MDKGGTKRLVTEIVMQALRDYEEATDLLRTYSGNRKAREQKEEIEEFFESEWFQDLRALAPETISERIFEEVKNDSKRISTASFYA